TTLDPGTVANFTGGAASPGFLLMMLITTFAGLFFTSVFIGILVTGLQTRLELMRKGRSRVVETGQTVILGWSQQVFTIIAELVGANTNRQVRPAIVVVAPRDIVEMEDEVRTRVPKTNGTRLVFRTGNPLDVDDLVVAGIDTARSIIALAPDVDDPAVH